MTLKCLLITDAAIAKTLTGFIETTGTLSLQAHTTTVEDALPEIEKSMPDIILLGVEQYYLLKNGLAGREKTPVFICLVPEDYASDLPSSPVLAIGGGQLSYELFLHTVNRAIVQLLNPANLAQPRGESWFFIKSEYRMVKVNFEDILFCEGLKDYTQIYTSKKSKPIITLQNLKTFLDRLPPAGFVRIHRSYIVALNHIESISKKEVEIGEKVIPIGNSYRNNLLDIVKLYS